MAKGEAGGGLESEGRGIWRFFAFSSWHGERGHRNRDWDLSLSL